MKKNSNSYVTIIKGRVRRKNMHLMRDILHLSILLFLFFTLVFIIWLAQRFLCGSLDSLTCLKTRGL